MGSMLVPALLNDGHSVIAFDYFLYRDHPLEEHVNLTVVKGDLREVELLKAYLTDVDIVIHLACISNDPSFELDPSLGRSINLDAFAPFVELCKAQGVRRFIYASSSSVYGVKSEERVTEKLSLEPLTDYSLFKAECENILLDFSCDTFETVSVRPATVCGYSPRLRLDVVVNIFSTFAFYKREITVFGGEQSRPNVNILDMVECYRILASAPAEKINGEVFNFGFENHSVFDLANIVKTVMGSDINIRVETVNDPRSYRIDSQKFFDSFNYKPVGSIRSAVESLKLAFQSNLVIDPLNNPAYSNIKTMQLKGFS